MAATLTFDAAGVSATIIGAAGTYTIPLTVASAAGQERLVFVAFVAIDSATFGSVTVGGQAATLIGSMIRGNAGDGGASYVGAYRAPGTASTSIDVVMTLASTTSFGGAAACFLLAGADTVLATASAAVDDPAVSVNTADNGAVAAAVYAYSAGGIGVDWTGLTERSSVSIYSDVFSLASANITSASTPLTITTVLTESITPGTGDDAVAALSVSFNPVAEAASDENINEKSSMMSMGKLMGN